MTRRQGIIAVAQATLLGLAVLAAALLSTAADWQPIELVLLLFVLAVGSDVLSVELRGMRVSGAFLAIVLAMALLGPAPAAAIGAASILIDSRGRSAAVGLVLANVATFATFPARRRPRDLLVTGGVTPGSEDALGFAAVVFLVFMLTNPQLL